MDFAGSVSSLSENDASEIKKKIFILRRLTYDYYKFEKFLAASERLLKTQDLKALLLCKK